MNHLLKKLKNNDSGVILVTVILITIVLSIVAISILSLNVSQVSSQSSVVDNIKAEQLATGVFYQYYQQQLDGTGTALQNVPLDGKIFSVSITPNANAGPFGTDEVDVQVDYNN